MDDTPTPTLLSQDESRVRTLTLNRPDKLNALNPALFAELTAVLSEPLDDIDFVVLTGAGRAFAAGADIEHYTGLTAPQYRAFMTTSQAAYDAIASCSRPVIAAVDGYALGGGFELVLACDLVVATTRSKFGLPEARLGLLPGGGGTQRLPRLVGRYRANDLIMTARLIDARTAELWGLVNRLCEPDELASTVESLLGELRTSAPLAIRMAKRLIQDGEDLPLAGALRYEQDATAGLYATQDAQEGIAAFVAKRTAVFSGT